MSDKIGAEGHTDVQRIKMPPSTTNKNTLSNVKTTSPQTSNHGKVKCLGRKLGVGKCSCGGHKKWRGEGDGREAGHESGVCRGVSRYLDAPHGGGSLRTFVD